MDKDIPSIMIASCPFDDVFVIAGVGILIGFAFHTNDSSSLTWKVLKAPAEVITGILIGSLAGFLISVITRTDSKNESFVDEGENGSIPDIADHRQTSENNTPSKLILLLLSGLTFVFTSNRFDFSGSGSIGSLVIASMFRYLSHKYSDIDEKLTMYLEKLWGFMVIILFALIGYDAKISSIGGNPNIVYVFLIGLVFRSLTTYCVVFNGGLNLKEKSFISIAWNTKAAVQASIGSIALTVARLRCNQDCDHDQDIELSKIILTASVLTVLICAPLGALGMEFSAPFLLEQEESICLEDDQHVHEINGS